MAQSKKRAAYYESLLSSLPDEFTMDQLSAMHMEMGCKTNVRMVIYRWVHNGIIEKTDKHRYRKIA